MMDLLKIFKQIGLIERVIRAASNVAANFPEDLEIDALEIHFRDGKKKQKIQCGSCNAEELRAALKSLKDDK